MPTIAESFVVLRDPGHPANQTYQTKEARHLKRRTSEVSDLKCPEGTHR